MKQEQASFRFFFHALQELDFRCHGYRTWLGFLF